MAVKINATPIEELDMEFAEINFLKDNFFDKDWFAMLDNVVVKKILEHLDHDSLLAMVGQCRQMAIVALPLLKMKRLEIISDSEFTDQLDELKSSIFESEKYLKRVLRTNEDLTYQAFNIQLDRHNNKCKSAIPWMLSPHLLVKNDLYYMKEIAYELDEIARAHCYDYREKRERVSLIPTFAVSYKYNLGLESMKELGLLIIFLIFEDFMQKYPLLSKFTSIQWPDVMPDKVRKELVEDYAIRNMGSRSYRICRMNDMRMNGIVENKKMYSKPHRRYMPYCRWSHSPSPCFDWTPPTSPFRSR